MRDEATEPRPSVSSLRRAAHRLRHRIEPAVNAERERALLDAARKECVFCAGVDGYNSTPVQAALPAETDAGNYVHRNDPPHGLAGSYCKTPRIRALITEVKTNAD